MIIEVFGWHCAGFLQPDEAKKHCIREGGADSCQFLLLSQNGFECCFNNAYRRGIKFDNMVAQRRGCEELKNFEPVGMEHITRVELKLIPDSEN